MNRIRYRAIFRPPPVVAMILMALLGADSMFAATDTWVGTGADNNWLTVANWNPAVTVAPGASLTFGGINRLANNNNLPGGSAISGIVFSSGAGAFFLSGSSISLTGNVTNSGTNLETINLPIAFAAPCTFTMKTGGGNIAIGSVLSGSGAVTTSGTGTLTLSGSNTYTGATTVSGSTTLVLSGSNTTGAGATTIGNGATLQLQAVSANTVSSTCAALSSVVPNSWANTGSGTVQLRSDSSVIFAGLNNMGGVSSGFTMNFNVGSLTASGSNQTLTIANSGNTSVGGSLTLNLTGSNGYMLAMGNLNVNFNGSLTLNPTTANITIGSILNFSTGTLVKSGAGTLVIAGTNTNLGGVTINGGVLGISTVSANNNAVSTTIVSGATTAGVSSAAGLAVGQTVFGSNIPKNTTIAAISGTNITLSANATASGTFTENYAFGNALGMSSNSGTNLVLSSGTLRYTGAAAATDRLFSIGTGNGTLDASGSGAINFNNTGAMSLNNQTSAATLTLTGSNTGANTLAALIADSGTSTNIVKSGSGTWRLSGNASTYTGTVMINSGILNVSSLSNYGLASAIGARTASQEVATGNGIGLWFAGGTLQYTGAAPQSTNRQIRMLDVATNTIDASGSVPSATLNFTYSGTNTNLYEAGGPRTLILTGSNSGMNVFNISLTDQNSSTGQTSLTKSGPGTWAVTSGSNTYSGQTSVNAGTLLVNGIHAATPVSGVDSGKYVVTSGATLGGIGTIRPATSTAGGTAMISAAGTLAPGGLTSSNGVGTLTLDGANSVKPLLSMESGGSFSMNLALGYLSSQLAVVNGQTGDVAFNNSVINFNDTASGLLYGGQYLLFTSQMSGAYSGLTTGSNGVITAGLSIGTGLSAYPGSQLELVGNNIVLNLVSSSTPPPPTLDTLDFGSSASETAHGLTTSFPAVTATSATYTYPLASGSSTGPASEIVTGGLGSPARVLLPRTPVADMYGGEMDFTMAVDPVNQNYFTVKFWGSDTMAQMLILNCNGYEVGGRHGDDFEEGSLTVNATAVSVDNGGWFPNRFIYRTVKLPLQLTLGQPSASFKIRSAGVINIYGSPYTPGYQQLMNAPTIGIYSAYTHTGVYLDTSAEAQGPVQSAPPTRTSPTSAQVTSWETSANNTYNTLISDSPSVLTSDNVDFLAQCYGVAWSNGYQNAAVPAQVIAGIDAMVTAAAADTNGLQDYMGSFGNPSWGGYFGPVGDAIRLLWPQISGSMSATVSYGGTLGTITRQSAWSQALRASIDFGRLNRKSVTNQELLCDFNIYKANTGLLLVDSTNALSGTSALRYLYEASGISPYMGNDQPGEGPTPVQGTQPFGPNWYFFTSKGTSKENGFATDYGEVGHEIYDMARLTGDSNLMAQALKVLRARDIFRFPSVDTSGYAEMMAPATIGCRRNGLPGFQGYLDQWEHIRAAADGAGSDLVGYFQQEMTDNQFFEVLAAHAGDASEADGPYLPGYYTAASAQPATGIELPMSTGQADFAWGDEENMAVAAKYREERFFAALAWRLETGDVGQAVNGMASVLDVAPQVARIAEVKVIDVQYVPAGPYATRSGGVDDTYEPPDNSTYPNAESAPYPNSAIGSQYPFAIRSDLTSIPPTNQDAGRGTAYTLRYGNWLVGMNGTYTTGAYSMKLPSDFASATDLVSGKVMTAPVTLPPQTTVVFYLPDIADPNPSPPPEPPLVTAVGGTTSNVLSWSPSAGATSYNIERALLSGGPYTTIATGVTGTTYTDTAVTADVTYYYLVVAVNAEGASAPPPPAVASAGLPSPWLQADVGAVGMAGSASYNSGTFTLLGSGAGMPASPPSQCHIVYQEMSGNGTIIARVVSPATTNGLSKCGIIMRQSLADNSQEAFMNIQPSPLEATFQVRASTGGTAFATSININSSTYWLELVRTGATFTGYASPDGVNWTQVGSSQSIAMADPIYVGMFVSSLDNTNLGQAIFDSVTASGWTAPAAPSAPNGLAAIAGNSQVALSWSGSSAVNNYVVERGAASGGPYTVIATPATAAYTDISVTNGMTYYYVVSAMNLGGEGANSSAVSATPALPVTSAEILAPALAISGAGGNLSATVTAASSVPGHIYQLQYTDDLINDPWQNIGSSQTGTGGALQFIAPVNLSAPSCFYRLQIQQ